MRRYALAGLLPLLVGCSLATEPEHRLVLADIAGYHVGDPFVEVTSSGSSATVRVTTFGSSCNARGVTEVRVEGLTATVEPYNYAPPAGTPCPRDLRSFIHEATVQFDRSGDARILVRGLDARSRSAANLTGDTLTVERWVSNP
jgi:hypothetical protein